MAGRKLVVEVAADISQYVRGLAQASSATKKLDVSVSELNVDTKKLTETAVRASVRRAERLEQEVAGYRRLAAAATKGSREQIAAANLAAQAERKLASSFAVVGSEARQASRHTNRLGHDLDHAARGALSGSGLFHSFGRSLAFASGGFIAFHEASDFIRESINAAREAAVAHRSLAAQMKASGESFDANRERIEKVALSYGKFGFQNDAVIASLTVLERGTGNINKAISLQGLTADLARAKNLDLAKAATVVAKVFGGQETALRRAVPGLEKNAHGWELIRQAQAKLAGQAAANTTASERFAATLHDTEEIVGTALLPTLNQYLNSLGQWLQKMNESGRLQKDVASATKLVADAFAVVKAIITPVAQAFKALGDIVGGTKNELKLLAGVFLTFKALNLASRIEGVALSVGKVGAEAAASTGKVTALRGGLTRLVANPYTITIALVAIGAQAVANKIKDLQNQMLDAESQTFKQGSPLETILVPRLAKQIDALKKAGQSSTQILATLRKQLGGSLKADDLISEAFAFSSGSDPALQARIRKAVRDRLDGAAKTVTDEVAKHKPATVAQRNTWFDQMISNAIGSVSDTLTGAEAALPVQLQRLNVIEQQLHARIDATKDITRRQKLMNQLQQVVNTEFQKQQQISDNAKQAAEAAKQKRAAAVQAMIDVLEFNVEKAGATKTASDNIAALRAYNAALEKLNREQGTTTERLRKIFENNQEIRQLQQEAAASRKQAALDRRTARQFRDLGLGPTGEALVPTSRALAKRLGTITDAIQGTFLDTKANRGKLHQIGRALADGIRNGMDPAVRQAIEEMFNNWRQMLNEARKTGTTSGRKARRNPFGQSGYWVDDMFFATNVVAGGAGGGGFTLPPPTRPATVTPRPFGGAGLSINNLNLYGVQDVRQLNDELVKTASSRPQPRRGP